MGDVRKMEEGKMVLHRNPLSLKDLIHRVCTMLQPSVKPGVKLIGSCNLGKNDWVLGDPHRIQQVLTNVITNAIKYTTSGQIIVSVKTGDKNVIIFECEDTGTGIPMNDQSKLFQRFVQRGGAPGTGLGLAIAKHLVDLIGGRIFFESDPTIKPGTTCIVEMPLERCDVPKSTGQGGKSDTSPIQEAISLLIVDDIKMNRAMFRRRITKGIAPKAKITEVSTGEEALAICNKTDFDVIIMDQHMDSAGGVILGTDTVMAMRRRKINSVIVGCSGNDIDGEFMESGTDWVMKKPTPPNEVIVGKLRHFLALRKKKFEENPLEDSTTTLGLVSKKRPGSLIFPPMLPPKFKKQKSVDNSNSYL